MAESSLRFNAEDPETLIQEGLTEWRIAYDAFRARVDASFEDLALYYNPIDERSEVA